MAQISKDFILEDDLKIVDGDFAIEEADAHNISYILQASKGQFYSAPLIGANISKFINSPLSRDTSLTSDRRRFRNAIRQGLNKDGYRLTDLTIDEDLSLVTVRNLSAEKESSKIETSIEIEIDISADEVPEESIIHPKQTIFDIALLKYGTIEYAYKVMLESGVRINDELTEGETIKTSSINRGNIKVKEEYELEDYIPVNNWTGFNKVGDGYSSDDYSPLDYLTL